MKPYLIIKAGSSYKPVRKKYGDFDQMIINNLPYIKNEFVVLNAQHQPEFLTPTKYAAIIITGAHENVTDCSPWMLYLEAWIKTLVNFQTPVLGICFGHQIIAKALGGIVGNNVGGGEFGVAKIEIENKINEPILSSLSKTFYAFVNHYQSVQKLPKNAVSLAHSALEQNQIVKYNDTIFGFQFHPEFTCPIAKYYLQKNDKIDLVGNALIYKKIQITNKIIVSNFVNQLAI